MDGHIIDCCSLLNLATGWGGLSELRDLRVTWHICQAVLDETEYLREYGPDATPILVPLDMRALNQDTILLPVQPETVEEMDDYVNFAMEVDDGEAQALAIAKNRGFVLLTDDRKAAKLARQPEVAVRTVSTVDVLRAWADLHPANRERLYQAVPRIATLARFSPRAGSPDLEWWRGFMKAGL